MLMDRLCRRFGKPIETENKGAFYTFPTIADIAQCSDIEETFKELGFGYRAKYYATTVRHLVDTHACPETFLVGLRRKSLDEARKELLKLSGVGPKVADCICLMALDKHDAVPVDTHIWQVAQRRYVPRLVRSSNNGNTDVLAAITVSEDKVEMVRELAGQLAAGKKAPTVKSYEIAQQLIIALFGPYAGWAQGMLFSSDLGSGNEKQDKKNNAKQKTLLPKPKRKAEPSSIESAAGLEPENIRSRLRVRKNLKEKI
ncbi:8-oxoguanine glycosylase ogg1 [Coemansia asiatica]|uniref:DNA-(apurinic or apyrimidinic site) lyase n=1 Tax=Coemansia asiatica TaxID=1052880 RepID=A0A9W7XRP2_9FUNG|nr:8-oxoguanine glycosylase ogg1 [Coemansia asiatica]